MTAPGFQNARKFRGGPSRWLVINLAIAGLVGFATRPSAADTSGPDTPVHFANADDSSTVATGKPLYMRMCASCHWRRLQGQPLWQLEDRYRGQRAPAHDQTGHTWAHSDEDLFRMTRDGRFPESPPASISYMPAFRDSLTDEQILSVIAFIKATWPIGLRISQAMLNPGEAGMPADSANVDWTLPPNCTSSTQRWRETSR
jgi:mono/diheme cytochrome c family protein